MASIITTDEYTEFTNDDAVSVLSAAYVTGVFEGISVEVRQWANQDFGPDTYTDERVSGQAVVYNRQACLEILTLHAPISSVSAAAIWYAIDADPTTLAVADAVLNPSRTGFWLPFGTFALWQPFVTIGNHYTARTTYVAGEAADYAVKMAVALLCEEWFALQAGSSSSSAEMLESWKLGDYQEKKAAHDVAASSGLGMGTQLSIRAYQLLDHYRRSGVVFL